MDNLSLKEEQQILAAARQAGKEAPEKLDTERARTFVHAKMQKSQRSIFRAPVTYVAFALAACLVAVLLIFKPGRESQALEVLQQDQMHAAADSLEAGDTLAVQPQPSFELSSTDE